MRLLAVSETEACLGRFGFGVSTDGNLSSGFELAAGATEVNFHASIRASVCRTSAL